MEAQLRRPGVLNGSCPVRNVNIGKYYGSDGTQAPGRSQDHVDFLISETHNTGVNKVF
jgi:hypothetical protein